MTDLTRHDIPKPDVTRTVAAAVGNSLAASPPIVSIVVMAYNEAHSLTSVLEEIDEAFGDGRTSYEVIIVDDGSTDATRVIAVDATDGAPHRRLIRHPVNRGLGEVYRSGFTAAAGDFITFLPADGQFPAAIVTRFLLLSADADLVLGRLAPVGRDSVSALLSKLERIFYGSLFGPLPEFQGVMMFRRELLTDLDVVLGGRGWRILTEIIVKSVRAGKIVRSEETPLRPRISGRSKVKNLRSVWANVVQALGLWVRLRANPTPGRRRSGRPGS